MFMLGLTMTGTGQDRVGIDTNSSQWVGSKKNIWSSVVILDSESSA